MDLSSLYGGGDKTAPAGSTGIGGSGKGASGAATIFGNNGDAGLQLGPLFIGVAGLAGLAVVGLIVWLIVRK